MYLIIKPYSALLVTSHCTLCNRIAHCAEKIVSGACAQVLRQQKGWEGEVGGCRPQVLKRPWLVPGHPDCMDRLRKHYSHLVDSRFLVRMAAWALSGCIATDSADYCMLVNEWAWSKSRVCL